MNKKRIMAILAAGVFSAVSVNPTAVMADSDTEPTTETGEMFYVDGDSTDGQMIVSEDGTPLQKTVKASEMGMSSEETLDFPFMGLSAELPDELKKQMDSADVVLLTKNSEPAPTASSNITSAPTARRKKISPMRLRTSRPLLAR